MEHTSCLLGDGHDYIIDIAALVSTRYSAIYFIIS